MFNCVLVVACSYKLRKTLWARFLRCRRRRRRVCQQTSERIAVFGVSGGGGGGGVGGWSALECVAGAPS